MQDDEELKLYRNIEFTIKDAQYRMVERKARLGESIVIADEAGQPVIISAKEALHLYVCEPRKLWQ